MTTRPRHTVTDTGELSEQPDQAQRRRLEASDRARAVEETAGALSGVYEPDELERLREDWPR